MVLLQWSIFINHQITEVNRIALKRHYQDQVQDLCKIGECGADLEGKVSTETEAWGLRCVDYLRWVLDWCKTYPFLWISAWISNCYSCFFLFSGQHIQQAEMISNQYNPLRISSHKQHSTIAEWFRGGSHVHIGQLGHNVITKMNKNLWTNEIYFLVKEFSGHKGKHNAEIRGIYFSIASVWHKPKGLENSTMQGLPQRSVPKIWWSCGGAFSICNLVSLDQCERQYMNESRDSFKSIRDVDESIWN